MFNVVIIIIIIIVLETAKKIDPTPADVEIVNVYPGDSKNWIERFSEDIEFEDVCVENEMTGTGIPHAQQTKQSIPNSKKINLIIMSKLCFKNYFSFTDDCAKKLRARVIESVFSGNIVVHRIENIDPFTIPEFIQRYASDIEDVWKNSIKKHIAVKTSLDLVTVYKKIINVNSSANLEVPTITQTLSISPFVLTPSSSISEWITTIKHLLQNKSEEVETRGSGWVFSGVIFLDINCFKYDPIRGGCNTVIPKKLLRKNALTNIECEGEDCFFWAVVASLYPVQSRGVDRSKPDSYPHYNTVLNTTGFNSPITLSEIKKFEKNNNISINVYTYANEKIAGPLHLTEYKRSKHVNLLFIDRNDKPFGHFCCISNLERLVSTQLSKHNSRKFLCDGCLLFFYSELKLKQHQLENCMRVKTVVPKPPKNIMKFQNYNKQFPVEFVIYADFESILKPIATCDPNPAQSFSNKISIHEPHSFSYFIKCSYDENLDRMELYRGENCVKVFIEKLREDINRISDIYSNSVSMMPLTLKQEHDHYLATVCHICGGELRYHDKVFDHCHLTGKYRGAAHRDCNLKCTVPSFVPVILHNMQNYDSHFIITELGFGDDDEGIEVVAKTNEKYMSIRKTIKTTNNKRLTLKFILIKLFTFFY
ncbi:uncharacterized protein LOC126898309 [Daktulosphaira vitifoliae]|uniref:uncharacterized protein LOC126898309 n=1 Tax=Daktulosphaira vitifoliae TaxID=58002 RepID=UPI0021AAD387|nr:uncharacterized protein LOC126898309 [Daktulosphaira vitifoliae]